MHWLLEILSWKYKIAVSLSLDIFICSVDSVLEKKHLERHSGKDTENNMAKGNLGIVNVGKKTIVLSF